MLSCYPNTKNKNLIYFSLVRCQFLCLFQGLPTFLQPLLSSITKSVRSRLIWFGGILAGIGILQFMIPVPGTGAVVHGNLSLFSVFSVVSFSTTHFSKNFLLSLLKILNMATKSLRTEPQKRLHSLDALRGFEVYV